MITVIDDFYDDNIKQLAAPVVELLGDEALERATAAARLDLRAFAQAPTVEALMRFQIALERELRAILRPN